jgi:hypothetical protein
MFQKVDSFESLVTIYQTTRHFILEDSIRNPHKINIFLGYDIY